MDIMDPQLGDGLLGIMHYLDALAYVASLFSQLTTDLDR